MCIRDSRNTGRIVAGWFGRVVTLVVLYWFLIRPALAGEPLGLFSICLLYTSRCV